MTERPMTEGRRVRGWRRGEAALRPLALGLLGLLAGGCGAAPFPSQGPVQAAPAPPSARGMLPLPLGGLDSRRMAWVDETLSTLSLEEAVGQLVFPWLSGSYAPADDPELIEALGWVEAWGIGGLAISIGSPLAYAAKLNTLQGAAAIPLLVTSDFENGGPGMRINHSYALPTLLPQGGGTSFPPTMAFGAIGDPALTEAMARITATEARAVGVHLTFAPVLDLNSNPENPIINTRSFGEDPREVAGLGEAYLRGARAGGVLTTAKHFPGHGDTLIDSHLALPEVGADLARLEAMELVPFQAAIDAGVDAVMTAHVSVPGVLGPGAPPATLSPEFMTGLLREEMGFEGLLFTDALRMGAITEGYGAGEAAVLALEAGADVILIPESVPAAIEALLAAVRSGRVSRSRIDESVRRILEAKARIGLPEERFVSLEAVQRSVGVAEHLRTADRAAALSMTLPRDREGLVPIDPARVRSLLSITYAAPEDLPAGREFDRTLSSLVAGVQTVRIGPGTRGEELDALRARAASVDLVVVNAYVPPRAGAGTVALPEPIRTFVGALASARPTLLVSFGNPYLLAALPEVGSYLLAWGDREVSQRAAARALAGGSAISGRLPITLPNLHERGEGLQRAGNPALLAREVGPVDLLDEAGLVRGGGAADTIPSQPEVGGGGGPGIGLRLPAPPEGVPAPEGWMALPISPLEIDPATVGMDGAALDALDAYILSAIADSVSPGVALAVLRRGELVRLRGYGRLDWDPASSPVTPRSLYDVASLTKVIGPTTATMILLEEGRIDLDTPVLRYLPDFARGDPRKGRVTIRDLLLHESGLPAFDFFYQTLRGVPAVRDAVFNLPLRNEPGTTTEYSDIGFMTLAWVIEEIVGEPIDTFLERRLFRPLGMAETGYRPPSEWRLRIAPTERGTVGRPYLIQGEVHDENAWAMGGVSGHAGIFSTAQDLAVFARMLASRGRLTPCEHRERGGIPCGARTVPIELGFLDAGVVGSFTRRVSERSTRALGWDTPSPVSSAGDYFSAQSFGHTGFTGTSIWVDPELELVVVLLTNRVNATRENTRHIPFRREVHDRAALAIRDRPVPPRNGEPAQAP